MTGEWIRLHPIPYRRLTEDQQFHKYEWIEVPVVKSSDSRPESHRLAGTIKRLTSPLSSGNAWQARKDMVFPLQAHCFCCIEKERDEKKFLTLGIFKPRQIRRLLIEAEESKTWSKEEVEILTQGHLFDKTPETDLENVPYKFRYEFTCDHDDCEGHTRICTDWQIGASWRKWRTEYGDDKWESKFRQMYETEMMKKDTHFYVGTLLDHQSTWIIVGLFYPRYPEPTLFD